MLTVDPGELRDRPWDSTNPRTAQLTDTMSANDGGQPATGPAPETMVSGAATTTMNQGRSNSAPQPYSPNQYLPGVGVGDSNPTTQPLEAPLRQKGFFEVCINTGNSAVRLAEIPLEFVTSDRDLFKKIWDRYRKSWGYGIRQIFLKPRDVHFVMVSFLSSAHGTLTTVGDITDHYPSSPSAKAIATSPASTTSPENTHPRKNSTSAATTTVTPRFSCQPTSSSTSCITHAKTRGKAMTTIPGYRDCLRNSTRASWMKFSKPKGHKQRLKEMTLSSDGVCTFWKVQIMPTCLLFWHWGLQLLFWSPVCLLVSPIRRSRGLGLGSFSLLSWVVG